MEDDIGPPLAQQAPHRAGVADVGLLQRGAVGQGVAQVLAPAGGQVVDREDRVAARQEGVDEVRSDEAGAAGDDGPAGSCAISWHA